MHHDHDNTPQKPWRLRLKEPLFTVTLSQYVFIISIVITLLYNPQLWGRLHERLNFEHLSDCLFLFSVLTYVLVILILFITLFSGKSVLKPISMTLVLFASVVSWFSSIGVAFDESMVVNVMETNQMEAAELLNSSIVFHLFAFGIVPCLLIAKTNITRVNTFKNYRNLGLTIVVLLVFFGASVAANIKHVSYFGRENRDLRLYVVPHYGVYSVFKYVSHLFRQPDVFKLIGYDAKKSEKHSRKRTVGVLVVGETARADHFSLNGYHNATNPYLSNMDVINFSDVTSCGTSTSYSVPCIFSFLGEADYSPRMAKSQSNVLDVLAIAGVDVVWLDNNSSCKGVCERVNTVNYRENIDPASPYYHHGEYLDEIFIDDIARFVNGSEKDVLIVLHQMGSHGPGYHKRYPEAFKKFTPTCESNTPHLCTKEAVSNSYDNSILYTDYFLHRVINTLETYGDTLNSFMLYVSDHGESLGENGVYLHGLPKSIAPPSQYHVPFVLWLTEDSADGIGVDKSHLNTCKNSPLTHDYIAHSLLSLLSVNSEVKEKQLDLLGEGCP